MTNDGTPRNGRTARRATTTLSVALLLVAASGCTDDADAKVSELTVVDAWARPTPAVAPNGAIYLTIVSPVDDVLRAVEVPADIAAQATLHETVEIDGGHHVDHTAGVDEDGMDMLDMTGMETVPSVELPADEPVSFQPNGRHIMLEDLAGALTDGQRFGAVLTFEVAGERDVEVVVGDGAP